MLNLKKRLPPLDPLVSFEAAARHMSFTRAAEELSLSQAAVSQQIRNLEDHAGSSKKYCRLEMCCDEHPQIRLYPNLYLFWKVAGNLC